MNKANPLINKATNEIKTQEETQMNTEYRKLLLESLEKVHQNIDQATLEQLPNLVHAEVEILTMFENADQAVKANQSLDRLIDPELQSEIDALRD